VDQPAFLEMHPAAALGQGLTRDAVGTPLHEGDRVTWQPTFPCYTCAFCLAGDLNMCPNRQIAYRPEGGQPPYFLGTFSDYLYLPPRHPIFKIPDELLDEEVVSLNCAMATVFQGLVSAGTRQGHSVVIVGAGGLGLYSTAFAAGFGARHVITVDGQQPRLDLARELGATATLDINELRTTPERVERVLELTQGRGADVVLDAAGAGNLIQEGITMLKPLGTFVEVGSIGRGRLESIAPTSLLAGKRIIGSAGGRPDLVPRILDFLLTFRSRYPIQKVISHTFALADIDAAFAQSEWQGQATPVIRSAIHP
jgi:5-exo-hydroxycamphor dehydrogenase